MPPSILKRQNEIVYLGVKFITEWESKGQAAEWIKEQTGKTSNVTSQIKDCILGKQKTAFKYKWKYKTI